MISCGATEFARAAVLSSRVRCRSGLLAGLSAQLSGAGYAGCRAEDWGLLFVSMLLLEAGSVLCSMVAAAAFFNASSWLRPLRNLLAVSSWTLIALVGAGFSFLAWDVGRKACSRFESTGAVGLVPSPWKQALLSLVEMRETPLGV